MLRDGRKKREDWRRRGDWRRREDWRKRQVQTESRLKNLLPFWLARMALGWLWVWLR